MWQILTDKRVPPTPKRAGPTWVQFLRTQAEAITATNFFTVDLLNGTSVYVILAVIEHATHRVRILGMTDHPNDGWVTQMACNQLMDLDDHVESVKSLLRGRDTKFTAGIRHGVHRCRDTDRAQPGPSTRSNAIMERWLGSCRRELRDQTLVWNQRHLLRVLREYENHHNTHRPHRSVAQVAPLRALPRPVLSSDNVRVHRRDRVGGVIHQYTLAA